MNLLSFIFTFTYFRYSCWLDQRVVMRFKAFPVLGRNY